jgi:biotin carboxyl carrier protein
VRHEVGRAIGLKLRGANHQVTVAQIGSNRFRVAIDEAGVVDAQLERHDERAGRLAVNGHSFRLVTGPRGPVQLVEVDGVAHRISRDEGGILRSPAPALVVATPVAEGEQVEAGAPVLVLESMKMETVLRAPFAARQAECLVSVGGQVEAGAAVLRLDPIANGDSTKGASVSSNGTNVPLVRTPIPAR